MPESDGADFISLALRAGYISRETADNLSEEQRMFPGQNVAALMIKRGLLTSEQAEILKNNPPADASDDDLDGMDPPAREDFPAKAPAARSAFSAGQSAFPHPASLPPVPPGKPAPSLNTPPPPQRDSYANRPQALRPVPLSDSGTPASPVVPDQKDPTGTNPIPREPPVESQTGTGTSPLPHRGGTKTNLGARLSVPATDPASSSRTFELEQYLSQARYTGCSDVHFVPNRSPVVRKLGELSFVDEPPMPPERTEQILFSALSDEERTRLKKELQLDFAFETAERERYRCNIFHQRLGWEGEFRIISKSIPSLKDIGAPPILQKLTEYHQGLILVTGASGSGKSTTIAAMLEHINMTRTDHVVTVEDPIEYVYEPKKCQITQREIGNHTESFSIALRGALRQDPDVIMIGELRDLETTSIAITASETGHLVFSTLHTNNATRTVARILDVYPTSQREQICVMAAESLRGIVSQQLIPRRDEQGLVCAMEILVFTNGVAQVVKEGKTHQLVSLMQSGKRAGMQLMDDSLMALFRQGDISGMEAWAHAENKQTFESIREQGQP